MPLLPLPLPLPFQFTTVDWDRLRLSPPVEWKLRNNVAWYLTYSAAATTEVPYLPLVSLVLNPAPKQIMKKVI